MRDALFHLRRDSKTPLQTQLRELLVSAILQGQIPTDSPLPSSRKLAETQNVARNTVALAYQELVAEGFLVSHERRGYFVNTEILEGRVPAHAATARTAPTSRNSAAWRQRFKVAPSAQRNIIKPRDWQAYRFPFIYGQIEPGDVHFLAENAPRNCFRLGFSSIPVDRIEAGIRFLGEILRK